MSDGAALLFSLFVEVRHKTDFVFVLYFLRQQTVVASQRNVLPRLKIGKARTILRSQPEDCQGSRQPSPVQHASRLELCHCCTQLFENSAIWKPVYREFAL